MGKIMSEFNPTKARVDIARDLREAVQLWAELSDEALAHPNDREFPGGEALNLSGPVASMAEWSRVFDETEEAGDDTRYASDQEAERHILLVLGDWEERVRQVRDQPTGLRVTVPRAADYLSRHLDWIIDEFDEVRFLQRELRQAVVMLENVLKEGNRTDRSAAACFKTIKEGPDERVCGGVLERRTLLKRDCAHVNRAIEMSKGVADPVTVLRQMLLAFPEDETEHKKCDQGGRDDVYRCRECRGFYTEAEYWLAVREHYEKAAG